MFLMASRMRFHAFPMSADIQSGTKSKGSQVAGIADDDDDELGFRTPQLLGHT